MDRYIVIQETSLDEFQARVNGEARQGYILHSYKHTVFDIARIPTVHHYSAVMELEPVEFDAMAFQKQYFSNVNN